VAKITHKTHAGHHERVCGYESGSDDDDYHSWIDDPNKYVPFSRPTTSASRSARRWVSTIVLASIPSLLIVDRHVLLLLSSDSLMPLLSFASDVPGEQPGRHHGVRAPRALHDRVLARHVAARQDGRDLLNWLASCLVRFLSRA
jgi:hypothetical protein